jgi:pimeloyl-ACP methyl ester carboxylesterase
LDRPGYGLSDPVDVPRERFREAAVEFVDETVDELGLESFAVAGGSMGGTWALWYALARPERVRRLALLGSAPLLPGTRAPAPLRVMAAPVVGDLLPRLVKPSAKMVVRMMSSMGEGDTIVRHPDLIEAIVAAGRDPIASATDLAELRAILTPLRFRRALRVQPSELQHLTVPTLLVWGDHDPVGTVEVAQTVASLIPHAQLDMVAAGQPSGSVTRSGYQDSCARSCFQAASDDAAARGVSHDPEVFVQRRARPPEQSLLWRIGATPRLGPRGVPHCCCSPPSAGQRSSRPRTMKRLLGTNAGCLVDERPASASPRRSESTYLEVMALVGMRGRW